MFVFTVASVDGLKPFLATSFLATKFSSSSHSEPNNTDKHRSQFELLEHENNINVAKAITQESHVSNKYNNTTTNV